MPLMFCGLRCRRADALWEQHLLPISERKDFPMKNTHTCPKCGGTDVLRVGGSATAYGVGNNILAGRTIFSAVLVHRYVCCGCGYSEEWIDREDIPRLEKKYR